MTRKFLGHELPIQPSEKGPYISGATPPTNSMRDAINPYRLDGIRKLVEKNRCDYKRN